MNPVTLIIPGFKIIAVKQKIDPEGWKFPIIGIGYPKSGFHEGIFEVFF
jgi:hypothetical protein